MELNNGKMSWFQQTILGKFCCSTEHCENCKANGVCDACDTIDGRWITAVNEYASTCDGCGNLTMHETMTENKETHLGYCQSCWSKQNDNKKNYSQTVQFANIELEITSSKEISLKKITDYFLYSFRYSSESFDILEKKTGLRLSGLTMWHREVFVSYKNGNFGFAETIDANESLDIFIEELETNMRFRMRTALLDDMDAERRRNG